MKLSLKSTSLAIVFAMTSFSVQADWSGTYTSSSVLPDGYTHTETDIVNGLNASGIHTYTNGTSFGSFEWTGTLTPTSSDWSSADLSGNGMIHNIGDRAFTITAGGLYLDNGYYNLWWQANDPMFGPIGWVTTMAAPVPIPAAVWLFGSALAGFGIIGKRRSQKLKASQETH